MTSERFARNYRLLSPADFRYVFDRPCKVSDRDVTLLCRRNDQNLARLGLAVPKKQVRLAVARNRIKRIVRESFRLHRSRLDGLDIVVLVRRGAATTSNRELLARMENHWQKLAHKCKNSSSH